MHDRRSPMHFHLFAKSISIHHLILLIANLLFLMFALEACGERNTPFDFAEGLRKHNKITVTEQYGKSLRGAIDGIGILVLRGTYEEMGEAHGALAGNEILTVLDQTFISYINKKKPNAWDEAMIPLAKSFKFPENYEKELAAIIWGIRKAHPNGQDRMLTSIGREITIDDLRALNCINDITNWTSGGCSSFSAWGSLTEDGRLICGRNLDYQSLPGSKPFMVLAREPSEKERKATIEISGPGYIGSTTAMNADGVFAMMHYVEGSVVRNLPRSVPRAIVVREALETVQSSDSIEKVAHIFRNRSVRIGNNTHIALPIQKSLSDFSPFVIEWDGNSLDDGATIRPSDPSIVRDAIICTNHFIKRNSGKTKRFVDSEMRFELLARELRGFQATRTEINFERAVKMMHSVSRSGETVTYLTVVAFPNAKKMIFAVTPARGVSATKGEWVEIDWNSLFGIE